MIETEKRGQCFKFVACIISVVWSWAVSDLSSISLTLKEHLDIMGSMVIYFLVKSSVRRLIFSYS